MCLANALALLLVATPIDVATARFDDVTRAVSDNGRARSREIMEAWVAAHPTEPDAGRGLVWIAQLWMADGHPEQARPFYQRAAREYPGTEWGNHGIRGMAELDVESRHYWAAVDGYQFLANNPAPFWNYVGRTGLAHARSERLRFFFFLAAAALLLGLCSWRVAAARNAGARLRHIPEECLYVLPVFILMIIASFHQPVDEGHTVLTLAVAGMAVLWANGVYLRARPPKAARRIVETGLGLAQAAAVLYCAVILNGVWSKFYETLVMGAE